MKRIKTLTILFSLVFLSALTFAQDEDVPKYIFGSDNDYKFSGFGGPYVTFSSVDNTFAVLNGGGGAFLINQTIYIGVYGEGLSTAHYRSLDIYSPGEDKNINYDHYRMSFGHGGFWLGYIHNYKKPVHWGVSTKIGWGSASLIDDYYYDHYEEYNNFVTDNAFVMCPQVEVEVNLFKWMKVNGAVGYRVVTGLNETYAYKGGDDIEYKNYFENNEFAAPYGVITFVFGWFYQ